MPHDHHPEPAGFGKAFAIGISLNVAFVVIEAFYGWRVNSLALMADAAHNLSDVGGLLLAWAAFGAARLPANMRHTYGWRRGSILASFVNAVVLLVAMGALAWEAIERLQTPSPVAAVTVMVVAAIGVVINALTAWLFMSGSKGDLNIRGAFLHMAADTLVSLGVVVAGGLYLWWGWSWTDPVVSLLIALVIVAGTWSLFHKSLHLLFDGVPEDIDLSAVQLALLELPGVVSVHDLHVWALSTTDTAITAHLVLGDDAPDNDSLLAAATGMLHDRFGILHSVLQPESEAYAHRCPIASGC